MATQADLARQLLQLAEGDAVAARALLGSAEVSDMIVCFHAQQAVEKALKAVLAVSGVDFPFTHDLGALVELCEREGASVPEDLSDVGRLTEYGVSARYKGVDPGSADRKDAERWAASAVQWATGEVDFRAT
jgi:HEPN domain-containing protein